MGPCFAEEIAEYLRVSGPVAFTGLVSHFARWGATESDIRTAVGWLLTEHRIAPEPDRFERYRLVAGRR